MKIEYNSFFDRYIKLTKNETKKLNQIKRELFIDLNEYANYVRENIDIELSPHLKKEHKLSVLWNIRFNIITNNNYIDHYKNVLVKDINNTYKIVDNDNFLLFANSYNILEDQTRGFEILRMIIKVKMIEWMIENEYNDIVEVKFIKPYNKDHLDIFTPYGYELFLYLDNEYFNKKIVKKYSNIYHAMLGYRKGKIKANKTEFHKWLKPKLKENISKIYPNYDDDVLIKNLIQKYIKANKDLQ